MLSLSPLQAMVVMELLEGGDLLDCLRRMQQQRLAEGPAEKCMPEQKYISLHFHFWNCTHWESLPQCSSVVCDVCTVYTRKGLWLGMCLVLLRGFLHPNVVCL